MGSSELLKAVQNEARELAEELPFQTYLARVQRDSRLARLSHQLVHDMVEASGISEVGGRRSYGLFRDELFGVDDAIAQVAEYFGAAARRLDVRKRILVLVGPPGCGKSTLVNTLKQVSRTARGRRTAPSTRSRAAPSTRSRYISFLATSAQT